MAAARLIFIDMDGTIIYGTYSGEFLCRLNGASEQAVRETERREREQGLNWIDGDLLRAPLMKGLSVQKIDEHIHEMSMIGGLGEFVSELKAMGFVTVLASAGPSVAARALAQKWGFDHWFASEYEVKDGLMTGEITSLVTAEGKAEIVWRMCSEYGVAPAQCAAMGDGGSDPDMLRAVGCPIALNADPRAIAAAKHSLRTADIRDALPILRSFTAEA